VVLGANRATNASLSQNVTDTGLFLPGCQYNFSFFAGGSLAAGSTFTGSVVFLDAGGNEIGRTDITIIGQSITAGVGKYYYVITPTAPANLASIRVEFVKERSRPGGIWMMFLYPLLKKHNCPELKGRDIDE